MSDQLVPQAAKYTSHNVQETNINADSRIRTRDSSNRAAADLRFGPRGHRDRPLRHMNLPIINIGIRWKRTELPAAFALPLQQKLPLPTG